MKINKILAIAINEYDDVELNKIQNCRNDVENIISILTQKYEFEEVDYIYEKGHTTRKALFNKLNSYFLNTLEDENVLLIYAGHGEYNPMLEAAFWQPSDADPNDQSTWINISEILTFIRAAKAFHISVISDSCFSGAIFEPPKRGGGIEAFASKRSRLGLTSGGIEKVSDGVQGGLSPFAEALVKQLNENSIEELPFSILANNLLIDFTPQKNQTPMCGSLNSVGHEGGSFVFKLKNNNKEQTAEMENMDSFLESKLGNLYIKLAGQDIEIIKEIQPINKQKHDAVKQQKYEQAARLRDIERSLEDKVFSKSLGYIDSFFNGIEFSKSDLEKIDELDKEIEKLGQVIPEQNERLTQIIENIKQNVLRQKGEISIEDEKRISDFAETMSKETYFDPAVEFFQGHKDYFLEAYKEGISKVLERTIRLKATSSNEFLTSKLNDLKEIMVKIYKHELTLLIRGNYSVEEMLNQKEIEIQLLKWIKN